jgi:4-amino-4-deoxy-L-arabinose transferase-like glycosyltransferase
LRSLAQTIGEPMSSSVSVSQSGSPQNPVLPAESREAAVWAAIAVAFLARFGWVLLAHKYRSTSADHFDFGQEIGCIARSLASGHGFSSPFPEPSGPTTWIAPVYPFLTATVFKIFGIYSTASALVMLGFNCAASALTCLPLFAIAQEVTNRRVALVSTWLWAVLPPFMIWAVEWVLDATLTTLVFTCLILLTIRLSRDMTLRRWIGFGLAWGVAALLNPSSLSALPFTVGYIAWKARNRGERWFAPAALCCFVAVLTVSPWLIRNYVAFGKFIFIRGNFWLEMRMGNSPYGDGTWMAMLHPEINHFERKKYLQMGEQQYFESKKQDTLQFIHEYPWYFRELCFRRVLLYWWDFQDMTPLTSEVMKAIARRTFSTLSLVGVIFLWIRRREAAVLLTAVLLVFPLPYYLTYPYGRYRHVIEPLLLICAVYAIAQVREFKNLFAEDSGS